MTPRKGNTVVSADDNRQSGPRSYACMPNSVIDTLVSGVLVQETGQPVFVGLYVEGKRPTYRQTTGRGNNGVLFTPLYVPLTKGGAIPAEPTHWVGGISYRADEEKATIAAQHHGLPAYVLEDMQGAGVSLSDIDPPPGPASASISADAARWLTSTFPAEISV